MHDKQTFQINNNKLLIKKYLKFGIYFHAWTKKDLQL